jgi:hypothetical protein
MKHLLKKKLSELTPQDLKELEKPLGTSTRPFPMFGTERKISGKDSNLEQVLSVIADNSFPMKVYSERPYEEVMALAYCDMPVPSMLPLFFDGLERRKPESTNRTQMMIGDPGHGKSFLGALQARLRTKGPVEVLDCGGKNMRELLFEMVLDFGAGDALPAAIDKRAAAGTLQSMSVALLRQLNDLGDDKTKYVNFGADQNNLRIDWEALRSGSPEKINAAFEILSKVSKIEGLDNAGGNALGMNTQFGPLIQKWIAGEEIVLDEYNKSREGTDDNLQTVWQFMIGEISECTVENPMKNKDTTSGPTHFTFRRKDLKPGFFVTLTGNKKEDGLTTRSLNKSVYSRLSPDTLPDPLVIDWQHRICQMMVGIPVSTLYYSFKEHADARPAAFGQWLMHLREAKAEIEGVPIPELQLTLLQNWKNVVSASQKLAEFYSYWSETTDAEKITALHPDLIEEVDEEYSKKEGIDFRKIKQHLERAIPIRPRMQPEELPVQLDMGKWTAAPKLDDLVEENQSLHFGTRLTEFLERMVYEKTAAVGKKTLYAKLKSAMEKFGLRDIALQEGARSLQKSVEDSLNISIFFDGDLSRQAEASRKIFCDYVRSIDPEIKGTNDDIVMPKTFKDILQQIGKTKESSVAGAVFVLNSDRETLMSRPILEAKIADAVDYDIRKAERDFGFEDVMRHADVMTAFAMPGIGPSSLSGIWEKNLRRQVTASESGGADVTLENNNDLDIAENCSQAFAIGATTFYVRNDQDEQGKKETVAVHVVHNSKTAKTLIVSEKLPSKLMQAFQAANITHVDRHADNAQARVALALADITRGLPDKATLHLSNAFYYRNGKDFDGQGDADLPITTVNEKLAANLVNDNWYARAKKFVVKSAV